MALHEKKLPFESCIIDLPKGGQYEPWYLQINPRGEVPVLQDCGKLIPDSTRIIDYLEDHFCIADIPKLIPMEEGFEVRQRITYYRHILDQIPAGILTMGSFFHPELVKRPKAPFLPPVRKNFIRTENNRSEILKAHAENNPECRHILLKKLEFHERRHQIVTNKEEFLSVLNQVEDVLDKVEEELASHNHKNQENWWLCSNTFTVADISLTILLERLNQLGFECAFWKDSRRPNIEKYYKRVQERESYKKSIPNIFFHLKTVVRVKPIAIGCAVVAGMFLIVGGFFIIRKMM